MQRTIKNYKNPIKKKHKTCTKNTENTKTTKNMKSSSNVLKMNKKMFARFS